MARNSQPREDLLRDARALTPRIRLQLQLDGEPLELIAGFRGDSLSLYFGEDPVYHFNAAGQLRRAFVGEQLIKAENGRLVFLRRVSSDVSATLERQPPDNAAEEGLLAHLQRRLDLLRIILAEANFQVTGEAPAGGDALPRLMAWLTSNADIEIATSPRVD